MAPSGICKNLKEEVSGVPDLIKSFLAADRDQLDLCQLVGVTSSCKYDG